MTGLIQVSWRLEDNKTRQREIRALSQAMEETDTNQGTILTYNEEETLARPLAATKFEIRNSNIEIRNTFK